MDKKREAGIDVSSSLLTALRPDPDPKVSFPFAFVLVREAKDEWSGKFFLLFLEERKWFMLKRPLAKKL